MLPYDHLQGYRLPIICSICFWEKKVTSPTHSEGKDITQGTNPGVMHHRDIYLKRLFTRNSFYLFKIQDPTSVFNVILSTQWKVGSIIFPWDISSIFSLFNCTPKIIFTFIGLSLIPTILFYEQQAVMSEVVSTSVSIFMIWGY